MFYTIQGTPIGKVQTLSQKKRQKEIVIRNRKRKIALREQYHYSELLF